MNTAQNLKFPKKVLERISGTLTLSCFQYALLKGVVRHTALMMFHSIFKVTSVQVSSFSGTLSCAFPPLPYRWAGNELSGLFCPITQLSKQQCLSTESECLGIGPVPSFMEAFGRLGQGFYTSGILSSSSFYIVLMPEGCIGEGRSLFFWALSYIW